MNTKICFWGCDYKNRPSEYDYLIKDIFSKIDIQEISFVSNIENLTNKDILVYHCFDPKNIKNFYPGPTSPTYEELINICNIVKPNVIIQLSDEHESHNNDNHNSIADRCQLFIRQYNHLSHSYDAKIIFLPLGYNNGFTNIINTKPLRHRKYNWSWSGSLKNDRMWMISIFSYLLKGNVHINSDLNKSEVYSLYSDSVFVPCGKGYSSYDCFRIYETIVSGAIPVVVGAKDEIENTFSYNGCPTPLLYYNTWEEAVSDCSHKLKHIESLEEIQKQLIKWWTNKNNQISKLIQQSITK